MHIEGLLFGWCVMAVLLSPRPNSLFGTFSVSPRPCADFLLRCSALCAMLPWYPGQFQLPHTHLTECDPMWCCDVTKDQNAAVVFQVTQQTCMFAMFELQPLVVSLLRALPLCVSPVTTHLLCSRVPCWVGLRHGRSV